MSSTTDPEKDQADEEMLREFELLQRKVLFLCVRAAHTWATYTQSQKRGKSCSPVAALDHLREARESLARLYAIGETDSPIRTENDLVEQMTTAPTERWLFGLVGVTDTLLEQLAEDGEVEITDYATSLLDEATAALTSESATEAPLTQSA